MLGQITQEGMQAVAEDMQLDRGGGEEEGHAHCKTGTLACRKGRQNVHSSLNKANNC